MKARTHPCLERRGRAASAVAVLMVWCVVCCFILYSWEMLVNVSPFKSMARFNPMPISQDEITRMNISQTLHSMGGASQPASLGDDLALPVDLFTGSGGLQETVSHDAARLGGVVERFSTSGFNRSTAFALISQLNENGLLDFREVARYPVPDEYLTPMDRDILADGPVTDLTTVASPDTSRLEVMGVGGKERRVKVGETVTVRVIVKDTKGRPVLKGGHQVRVWMVSKDKTPKSAAVEVRDLRNGTFLAAVPVLWPGVIELRAALQRPREFNRLALTLMNTMKMMNEIVGAFVSGTAEEVTLCSFIPVIPGYQQVCNLTTLNGGLPWYCGRPSTPGIQCHHWAWTSFVAFPRRYPLSDTENALMNQFIGNVPCIRKIQANVTLTAVPGGPETGFPANKVACQPVKPRDTWEDQSPRGYWIGPNWRPLKGCPLPKLTKPAVLKCLHNTTFLSYGDSNVIRMMWEVQTYTQCDLRPDPLRSYHPNMLHVPLLYHCLKENLHLRWYPHAYPFFTGYNRWSDCKVKDSLGHILDRAPASEKYVLLIHLFNHFAPVHTHIYVQHVRAVVRAVREFVKRHPRVQVFIRGPHAQSGPRFTLFADFFTQRCLRVLRQEFRDLRDKVVLLNAWDMSVAAESCDVHPKNEVPVALCSVLFQHLCPNLFMSG